MNRPQSGRAREAPSSSLLLAKAIGSRDANSQMHCAANVCHGSPWLFSAVFQIPALPWATSLSFPTRAKRLSSFPNPTLQISRATKAYILVVPIAARLHHNFSSFSSPSFLRDIA
ncbi:hypothetical protein MN608_05696 [Microdochium nivale]|nr:hypothetical protein MN608_05696 [Microdochium nivale]